MFSGRLKTLSRSISAYSTDRNILPLASGSLFFSDDIHCRFIIFNFQTSEITRVLGAYRKGKVHDETMYNFFGDVDLSQARSGVDLLREYKNNLKKHRDIVENITIKGGGKFGNFYYDLIFATKRTKGGNPWFFNSVTPLKSCIETHSGEAVQMALDILTGRQMTLDWFISEDDEQDNPQRSLFDF